VAIRTRLAEYREKTQPILDLRREKELIVMVDGTPPPDVVQAEIRRKLGLAKGGADASEAKRLAEVTR
jgi:adenylate kinase